MTFGQRAVGLIPLAVVLIAVPAVALASGEAGHHAEFNWFDFSSETPPFIAALINFALLVVVLYFILRKSLAARFKNRKEDFEQAYNAALEAKAEAERAMREVREALDEIDDASARIREDIIAAARARAEHITSAAEKRAKRLKADAEAMAAHEFARAAYELRREVAEEVVRTAEALLREKMTGSDHERLARGLLQEIASADAADASGDTGVSR